jgi:hypothetical protein
LGRLIRPLMPWLFFEVSKFSEVIGNDKRPMINSREIALNI